MQVKTWVMLDAHTRVNIDVEVSRRLNSHDVLKVLDQPTAIHGAPENNRRKLGMRSLRT
jgi:hypothetical protein